MLGRRQAQRSLFNVQGCPHLVPEDSFYGRMGAVSRVLFRDDDQSCMYCEDNGRPSWPPSLMSGILLLQFHDNVSDQEAVERLCYDLRWKVALDLPLDFQPPHPSSLSVYRGRTLEHGQERYAFNRLLQVGREAGFLCDRVTLLIDTTPQRGAGAVQNTYTLIRKGIRKVLKAAGYDVRAKRRGMGANLAAYLDSDEKAAIDWGNPTARLAQLKVLVRDAGSVLELASGQVDEEEVRTAAWLLTKILGDDVATEEEGDPKLRQGVAEDRTVSMTDPQMRHGRKSASQRFDGHKVHVAVEPASELLLAVEPMPGNAGDGRELLHVVQTVQEEQSVIVERVIADGAYGSGDNRAACMDRGIDLVSPLATPSGPRVHKSEFEIDVAAKRAICPQGEEATMCKTERDAQGRSVLQFTFDRKGCERCALFDRCVHSKTEGRSLGTHYHEHLLQAARQRQATPEFRQVYKGRAAVERKIAHLIDHGLRQARYIGKAKRRLQAQWTGAAINLAQLFRLFVGDMNRMRQALAMVT